MIQKYARTHRDTGIRTRAATRDLRARTQAQSWLQYAAHNQALRPHTKLSQTRTKTHTQAHALCDCDVTESTPHSSNSPHRDTPSHTLNSKHRPHTHIIYDTYTQHVKIKPDTSLFTLLFPTRRLRQCHRLGLGAHVHHRDRGRGQVLGLVERKESKRRGR